MSEFEKKDQEVMNLVNKGRATGLNNETAAASEQPHEDKTMGACLDAGMQRAHRQRVMVQERLRLILNVFLCLLIAVAFLVAMVNPAAVVIVTNAGVLCCGCVIAVIVDRFFRRKKW